jgi:hypothetical protein
VSEAAPIWADRGRLARVDLYREVFCFVLEAFVDVVCTELLLEVVRFNETHIFTATTPAVHM